MATYEELLLMFETNTCVNKPNTVGYTSLELREVYQETFPFTYTETITGQCLIWDEEFIQKCQYAMSTDDLSTMSEVELQTWKEFVEFEDARTTSANTDQGIQNAIGCTTPNGAGQSFVVTTTEITTTLCYEPVTPVKNKH